MAQRRPITSHPAFVPLLALWFAALFGLAVAVLPAAVLARGFAGIGIDVATPLTMAARLAGIGVAALAGLGLGLAIAIPTARRGRRDPRPVYTEYETAYDALEPAPVRRPLHVREEMADDGAEVVVTLDEGERPEQPDLVTPPAAAEVPRAESGEGFMILTPQPIHPPRPAPDLDGLLAQFDTALAAFRSGDEAAPKSPSGGGADPVQAFVARQTGGPAPSPLGGRMPDHQAELRAALDKLAKAHRKD